MYQQKLKKQEKLTPVAMMLVQAYDFLLKDPTRDLSRPHDAISLLLTQPELAKHSFEANYEPQGSFNKWAMLDFNRAWLIAQESTLTGEDERIVMGRRNAPDKKISIQKVLREGTRIRKEMFKFLGAVRTKLDLNIGLVRDLDIPLQPGR